MSMMTEIATEGTIKEIVQEIERLLAALKDKPDACAALKRVGRFALTQFEWNTPDWAQRYRTLFAEADDA